MVRRADARNRILETAGRLFHEHGYCGVGINQIIEEAGTAKATFYQHFPSKEDLCVTWLATMHNASQAAREELVQAPGDPAEKIDAYFSQLEIFLTERQFRGCPFTNTSSIPDACCDPIHKEIESHKLSIRDFFRDLAVQISGEEEKARQLGDELFLLYSGATMEAQNLHDIWPVQAARKAARERCAAESKKAAAI